MNPPVPVGCRAWLALVASLVLSSAAPRVRSEPSRPAALTAEQQKQLRERNRLWTQAQQLRSQGKLAEAVTAAEKALLAQRKLFGPTNAGVVTLREYLAGLYEQREDFQAALKARRQVLDLQTKLWGAGHWRVVDARLALADTERLARLKPEQRRQLAEAERLNQEGLALYRQGKFRAARDSIGKALAIRKLMLGEQHPDYATSLNNLASLYQAQGDYAKAEPLYRKALAIWKQALGEQHPHYAASLINLALLDQAQGDYARALPLFKKALAILKQALGEQHPDYAQSLNNLAELYQDQGDYAQAEPLYQKALTIRKQALGEQHPGYATSLNNLASLYQDQGAYARAEPLYQKALAIRKQALGEQHPHYAQSLNNLANLYQAQGDYAKAEPLCRQALAIRKQALGEQHPAYAQSLNNLAGLHQAQGDYAKAEPLYCQALALRKQALGEQHPAYATSLNNLASLYQDQGDYAKAEPLYLKALTIRKQALGEQHPHYAFSLNNLASLYQAQGDYAKAEFLYQKALAIRKQALGERHPDYATSLNNLALLYYAQGDYAQAEPLYKKALAIWKQALGEQHPAYTTSLNNLANLYHAQGDYAQALPLCRQALAIRKQALGEHHPAYAFSLNNLAGLYHDQGDYAKAEPLYRQALAITKQALGEQHPDYAQSLNNLAVLYQAQGDYAKAESLLKQGLGIQRHNLDLAADAQSERQQLALIDHLRTTLDAYLSLAPHAKIAGAAAYRPVLTWKGAVCARQRRSHRLRRLLHQDPTLARLAADLQRTGGRLAALAFAVPDPKKRAAWQRQLEDLSERKEQLEKALARQSAAFRAELRQQALSPAQLQAALPRDAALLDFLEYLRFSPPPRGKGPLHRERHLAAFVVRPGHPIQQLDLGPIQPIRAAIDQWRLTLQRSRPRQGAKDPAVQLRQLVWKPLAKHLDGVKTVLVSPDGALTRLPFAALPGQDPDTYLIEEVALAVVPVPQLLPQLLAPRGEVRGPPPALLALGDVDYDSDGGKSKGDSTSRSAARRRTGALLKWPALEETGDEVTLVTKAFRRRFRRGKVSELSGTEATEEALRRLAPRHRYLHLATHGFFAPPELRSALAPDPQQGKRGTGFGLFDWHGVVGFHPGLLSGLVLAGANRPPQPDRDDGILTALEVADLDLGNVELAVLSACETGLGASAGGEGLLGLQRAFQVAGARSVVASLWQVHDQASRELMERFYQNWWGKKLSRLEALRAAQVGMLREGVQGGLVQRGLALREARTTRAKGRTPRTPPLYWAAFQLSGDWR